MIRVMGAGAFGTALAITLSNAHRVTLWARDANHADEMTATRRNERRLPGVHLPEEISIESKITSADYAATLLAMPTQKLRNFCRENEKTLISGKPLVACCKGIELSTGRRPSEIISEECPDMPIAVLTGPSFAADIAKGMPTALTLACADDEIAQTLQLQLSSPALRLYRTTDVAGAELGGALKNVVAIACGAAIGAGLGESARAALMTRGFAEIMRAAAHLGANPATLNGLSGFGDLVLTCSSDQSRNFQFGLCLGRGDTFPSSVTVEGIATAKAVCDLANRNELDMPITHAVTQLASGQLQVKDAMDMLLSRPLKEEIC